MATHLEPTNSGKTDKSTTTGQPPAASQRPPSKGPALPDSYRFKDYASI